MVKITQFQGYYALQDNEQINNEIADDTIVKKEYLQQLIDRGIKLKGVQKSKALKYGILNLAGIDAAKAGLKKSAYNASLIPQLVQQFGLSDSQRDQLNNACVQNTYNKNKIQKASITENEEKKGQEQFNSDFNDKYQAAFDFDAKVQVSCDSNRVDPVGYYEFLISSSKQDLIFLQVIARVIENEQMEKQKLRLFLALCGLCTNKEVNVDANLQDSMLNYLSTQPKVLPRQTSGFFKLSFLNEVGISAIFNTGIVKKFDKRFANNFDDFWERLVGDDSISKRVFRNLPQTCLVLSLPMIRALKDCSIFHGIFPEHLKYFLTIFVYSFPTDNGQFKVLLQNVKESTKANIEMMKASQFQQFLENLTADMLAYNERWFRNYNAVHVLLTGVLQLISLNKVPSSCFSKQICDELIRGNIIVEELLDRPAQLSQECNIEDATRSRLNNLEACNSNLFFKRILAAQQIEYSGKLTPFNIKNIELKPEQQIFMSLYQSEQQLLLCTGAGVGKTTFLGGLVLSIALTNKDPILIINQNKRLLNRDFQDAIDWSQMIHGFKALTISQYTESQKIEQITFMTPQELKNAVLPSKFHIVVDELQLLFTKDIVPLVPLFEAAQSFVGVTGSPMPDNYRQMLQILLPGACIANFPDEYKWNTTERDVVFVSTVTQQLKQIDTIYKQQRQLAPLLCIMSNDLIAAYKKHDSKRQWVTFMNEMDNLEFNLILKEKFAQQKNGLYGCYVVTEAEGVGIEYPSTPQIDKNGGVVVCICTQPETYSDLAQWKRRTGRIGRPGVVYYVFQGKKDAGSQNYMKFLEKMLLKKEEKAVRELKAFLITELKRYDPTDSDSEIGASEENQKNEGKLQNQFKQQLNIQEKKELEMKNQYIKQIITSIVNESEPDCNNSKDSVLTQKQLMDIDIDSDEEGERDVCQKGCGKLKQIGTCFKCQDYKVWSIIGAHNCSMKDVEQNNSDQVNTAFNQNNKLNDSNKDQDMNIADKIAAKEDGSDIVLSHADKQTDIKEVLIEGGLSVNLPRADLKEFQKQQSCYNVDMKEVQIEGGISIKLPRSELKEFQFEIINNQDEKNNKIISFAGKKTNKRIAAPHTVDENSITPRLIQKTDETSNVYEELKNQDRKKKFSTGAVSSFGFVNDVNKEGNSFAQSDIQDEQVQEPLKLQKSNQEEELSLLPPVAASKQKTNRRTKKIVEKKRTLKKEY